MNPTLLFCCYLPLLIFLIVQTRKRRMVALRIIRTRRKGGSKMIPNEIVSSLLGQDCQFSTMNDYTITGILRSAADGWLAVETAKGTEALNLDFVTRIRPVPKKKKD